MTPSQSLSDSFFCMVPANRSPHHSPRPPLIVAPTVLVHLQCQATTFTEPQRAPPPPLQNPESLWECGCWLGVRI
jgi:hypothetical protein